MKAIIKQVTGLFKNEPLTYSFSLSKKYQKKRGVVEGSVSLLAKKDLTISNITFDIIQYTDSTEKTKKQKNTNQIISTSIANKKIEGPRTIERFKNQIIDFYLELHFNNARKAESRMYAGDMALMDRIHDESQKTVYSYEIIAKIKLKGESKVITIIESLTIE